MAITLVIALTMTVALTSLCYCSSPWCMPNDVRTDTVVGPVPRKGGAREGEKERDEQI